MIHRYHPGQSLLLELDASQKLVLVGGCFDVLHYGHLKFLQEARAHGDRLVVALESDDAIVRTKDRRVFHSQQQRAEILASVDVVSDVLMLPLLRSDEEYMNLVVSIRPAVIALTEGDPRKSHKEAQAKTIGGDVIEIPFVDGFSTTDLLHRYCAF